MIGSSTYNKHLVAVKAANDCEASHPRSCCIRSRPIGSAGMASATTMRII